MLVHCEACKRELERKAYCNNACKLRYRREQSDTKRVIAPELDTDSVIPVPVDTQSVVDVPSIPCPNGLTQCYWCTHGGHKP